MLAQLGAGSDEGRGSRLLRFIRRGRAWARTVELGAWARAVQLGAWARAVQVGVRLHVRGPGVPQPRLEAVDPPY